MSDKTKTPAPCPLAVIARMCEQASEGPHYGYCEAIEARAKVAELVAADREVDAILDEIRRAHMAGQRPGSRGTGWELRDAAAKEDRDRRYNAAQDRRAAALAAFAEVKS